MKPTTAKELFEQAIPAHKDRYLAHVAGIEAIIHFEIPGAGDWTLQLGNNSVQVHGCAPSERGLASNCKIWAKSETIDGLLSGSQKILSALLFGKVKVSGDIALAKKIATSLQQAS